MTKIKKVIEGLENCTLRKFGCSSSDCPYSYTKSDDRGDCIYDLCTDALELLKEREHIKPTVAVDTWICSNCGHTLESQTLIDDGENPQVLVNEQYDFCPQCGKEVRWE